MALTKCVKKKKKNLDVFFSLSFANIYIHKFVLE